MSNPQQPGRLCACGCGWRRPQDSAFLPGHAPAAVAPPARRSRISWQLPVGVVAGLAAMALVGAVLPDDAEPTRTSSPASQAGEPAPDEQPAPAETVPAAQVSPSAPAQPSPAAAAPEPKPEAAPLLRAASGGDGDSWRDTNGTEYRLGLINTPETNECFGSQATAERKEQTAAGFRAKAYATDRYGRAVSQVTTADGLNLNVHLARRGFADDRYLEQFRHENPALAMQLDAAFAAAKSERVGLWRACRGGQPQGIAAAPPPAKPAPAAQSGCHPDYATCIPVQGDGSGQGPANDLDCGDISGSVRLRSADVDPYRLDADGDGIGCD